MQFSSLLIQAALASAMGLPDAELAKRAESTCTTATVTQYTGSTVFYETKTLGGSTVVSTPVITSTWPGHTFTSFHTTTATTTTTVNDRNGGTGNGGGGGNGNGGFASGTGTGGSGSGGSGGRGQGGNA